MQPGANNRQTGSSPRPGGCGPLVSNNPELGQTPGGATDAGFGHQTTSDLRSVEWVREGEFFHVLPPSGRELLKSPSTDTQLLPSPPQIRQRSSRTSEPRTLSQPTCCREGQRGEQRGHGWKGHRQKVKDGLRNHLENLPGCFSKTHHQMIRADVCDQSPELTDAGASVLDDE